MTTHTKYHRFDDKAIRNMFSDLQKLWATVDEQGYPAVYQTFSPKAIAVIDSLPHLQNLRVLDLGCNSGVYSCLAAFYSQSVIGADTNPKLIERAQLTNEYFRCRFPDFRQVEFTTNPYHQIIRSGSVDCLLMTLVLYHIGDEQVRVLGDLISQHIKSVVIQVRPGRRNAFAKNPNWKSPTTTQVYNGLFSIEDTLDFLRDYGFSSAKITHLDALFASEKNSDPEYFPMIIATK
jgi:2-polyprenyl-3-methyl-5-hydroxy-6-metoxy-1,4-benzoquinol methylase